MYVFLILILTVPRYFHMWLWNFNSHTKSYELVNTNELSAFDYLKTHTDNNAVVLANGIGSDFNGPFVTYFTNHPTYFSGITTDLVEHGVNYQPRANIVNFIFTTKDTEQLKTVLHKEGVSYILLPRTSSFPLEKSAVFTEVYKNEGYSIQAVRL